MWEAPGDAPRCRREPPPAGTKPSSAGIGIRTATGAAACWGRLPPSRKQIGPELAGEDAADQGTVDRLMIELDGSEDRSRLGANAILAVSLASARAAAEAAGLPLYRALGGAIADTLPVPYFNVLNGGAHADNALLVQEFMVAPLGFSCFSDALRAGVAVYHELREVLGKRGHSTAVGDEGGFAPALSDAGEALELLVEAIEGAGFVPGEQMALALDVAANEFGDQNGYRFPSDVPPRPASAMIEIYAAWLERFPALLSIEDGLAEDDWEGWAALTTALGDRVQLVGDDLFVTQESRLQRGIAEGAANAILIKPNQVGTLTETVQVVQGALPGGLRSDVEPPVGRNPGHRDFPPGGCHRSRADQGRCSVPRRARRQVQRTPPHRGRTRGTRTPLATSRRRLTTCGQSDVSTESGQSSRWERGAWLTRRASEEYRMYFDRSATMSDLKRQFSRWGGVSAGMHRRSLPERGTSTAETPEREGWGTGTPGSDPSWLGNAA